jgi:nitrogen regulatory protein P-II 1
MKKIEAVIRNTRLREVKNALGSIAVKGMTVTEIREHDRQKGATQWIGGEEYTLDFPPRLKLDLIVEDEQAEDAVAAILISARTGRMGDGMVVVSTVDDFLYISAQEEPKPARRNGSNMGLNHAALSETLEHHVPAPR